MHALSHEVVKCRWGAESWVSFELPRLARFIFSLLTDTTVSGEEKYFIGEKRVLEKFCAFLLFPIQEAHLV